MSNGSGLSDQNVEKDKVAIKPLKLARDEPFELKLLLFSLNHKRVSNLVKVVLTTINISGFIYCIIGKSILYNNFDHFNNDVVMFINCLDDLVLAVVNILGVLYFAGNSFMLELLTFVSKEKFPQKKRRKGFARFIHLLRVVPIIPLCIDFYYFGYKVGWTIYRYFLPRDLWFYLFNLQLCSFSCLTNKVNCHFVATNDHLESLGKPIHSNLVYIPGGERIINKSNLSSNQITIDSKELSGIIKHYDYLCNLLDKFNRFVKPYLVASVLCIIVNILYDCTTLIQYGAKPRVINGIETKVFVFIVESMMAIIAVVRNHLLKSIQDFLKIIDNDQFIDFYLQGQAALPAMIGEYLQEESQRTTSICYSMLNKLNRNPKKETDRDLISDINFLLEMSKSRKICIHAGGFFHLNWGILGSIISTVATYCIVIIQFLLK